MVDGGGRESGTDSSFDINGISNKTSIRFSVPQREESLVGGLLKPLIACEAAERRKFQYEGASPCGACILERWVN